MSHPILAAIAAGFCFCVTGLRADIHESASGLAIELNAVSKAPGGCHLTFQIRNTTPADIDRLVYEGAFFTNAGILDRLALFDFGEIPADARRIRHFTAPGLDCETLGRVFLAEASICETSGSAGSACGEVPQLTSRTDVEVRG